MYYSDEKLHFYDYLTNTLICAIKHACRSINDLEGFIVREHKKGESKEEKTVIMFRHPEKLEFYEFISQNKKINYLASYLSPRKFIQNVFVH